MRASLDETRAFCSKIYDILLYEWDPIGISEFKNAHDEYVSYGDVIINYVNDGVGETAICDYLFVSATESMGLEFPALLDRCRSAASEIVKMAKTFGYYQ